jgi:hypothetical protein
LGEIWIEQVEKASILRPVLTVILSIPLDILGTQHRIIPNPGFYQGLLPLRRDVDLLPGAGRRMLTP